VLGQRVELISGDDFCDADQAVALARKLASDGVVFVVGHWCSHASIAAAQVYENAKILMISPSSASAKLTDEGGPNVFRVYGRDDRQGAMVADYLVDHWAGKGIAILDDGTTWGAGVADGARRRLQERGVRAVVDETITPDEPEYSDVVSKMQGAGVEVLFLGGYHREAGLILRQARDQGYDLQLIANSAMALEDFPMIVGPELEGTVMVAVTDMRSSSQARDVVERFRALGHEPAGVTLNAYAAVQVWAQAVEAAGSLDFNAVVDAMHSRQFATVLGPIGFDEKGDITGLRAVAMVRLGGGRHIHAAGVELARAMSVAPRRRRLRIPHCGERTRSAQYASTFRRPAWSARDCSSSQSSQLERWARGRPRPTSASASLGR
jgi:branched-chain amino acid transport system substrate-binding protein